MDPPEMASRKVYSGLGSLGRVIRLTRKEVGSV